MRSLLLLSLAFLVLTCSAHAEGATTVTVHPCSVSSVVIDSSTGKVAKAAGAAVSNTDGVMIARTSQHSVTATVTATQTVSLTITPQMSNDGTNFWTPTPSGAVTLAPTSAASRVGAALSLPAAPYYRFTLSSDATYPVTYTSVTLNSW